MDPRHSSIDADACYLALKARDARFDGRFFTGVTSTGIYCRPVCNVRTPKRENCRFFAHAAKAESAGFRPCLRCRPELAPGTPWWSIQDASAILAHQAARLLDDPDTWHGDDVSVQRLADRLGVSDRHVRRIFEAQFGVAPMQYLQTRRLLTAKQLLADTDLPVHQVAISSGFASVRRFNAAFLAHYRLNPTAMRRAGATPVAGAVTVRLAYRPPYDTAAMAEFFRRRQIDAVEFVDVAARPGYARFARTLHMPHAGAQFTGWFLADFDPEHHLLRLQVSDSLRQVLPQVIRRVRNTFDLDADPHAINEALHGEFPDGDGLRVPGTPDGFELAVRAVLGQQITVAAARTLAQRLVQQWGEPIATPHAGLSRLFPSAHTLAMADPDTLGALGVVRQRQRAIQALARAVADGQLHIDAGADIPATMAALRALPGIGDWTAHYIAMRALRWPDAFPSGDVALHKALGLQDQPHPARAAEALSQAWRPWRSYAVLRAWHGLPTRELPSGEN
ncbi:MAG: AlkA N-terminal domain-containing protein [Burkholderiaceae bacterium]